MQRSCDSEKSSTGVNACEDDSVGFVREQLVTKIRRGTLRTRFEKVCTFHPDPTRSLQLLGDKAWRRFKTPSSLLRLVLTQSYTAVRNGASRLDLYQCPSLQLRGSEGERDGGVMYAGYQSLDEHLCKTTSPSSLKSNFSELTNSIPK